MTLAGLVLATSLSGATATGHPRTAGSGLEPALRLLQLNLCDSGIAGCYTGRSVVAAAAVIRAAGPDVVTLNEICRNDLPALERALAGASTGTHVTSAFQAAVDRRTGRPFRCTNDEPYGIGIVARIAKVEPHRYAGVYPAQDTRDPEERVWLCLHADYYACTTHLASTSTAVALAQCQYLFDAAIPRLRTQPDPVVLGADLNLRSSGSPGVQSCLPADYPRADDDRVQHIVTSPELVIASSRSIDLHGSTDHPGLLADLAIAPAQRNPTCQPPLCSSSAAYGTARLLRSASQPSGRVTGRAPLVRPRG